MPKKRTGPFTIEERALILESYKRGDTIPDIARRVSIRPITLSAFLKAEGVFQPRRNKEYKYEITDDQIQRVFEETKSIRATAKKLHGVNPRYIKSVLERLGVEDITHYEVYERTESQKAVIIEMYERDEVLIPQICKQFEISKNVLRVALKKWGVYNVSKRPNQTLSKAGVTKEDVIETYERLRNVAATSAQLGLSASAVAKVLRRGNIELYVNEKAVAIDRDKETIIHRYSTLHQSCQEISKDYDVWSTTILAALKKWCVEIVHHKHKAIREKIEVHKQRICDLYENQSYALREIAEEFGLSHNSVIRAVKRWGLSVPDNRYKESSLERAFKKLLVEQGIVFKQFKQVVNRVYDFYLPEFDLIVECNGDYWHGNPRIYPIPDAEQIKGHKRDAAKNILARKAGHSIYFIWESEVKNKTDQVRALLCMLIAGHPPIDQASPTDFLTEHSSLEIAA